MSFYKPKPQAGSLPPKKLPWSEKYRPKTLGDVAAQDNVVSVLEKTLQSANIPHMLFYGPPGTGKTSTIHALAKDLFGPELFKTRVLELNASDERGISVVRDKIKNFAKTVVSNPPESVLKNYPAPPYKIIILDEADSMTQDAQAALRRIMENYSKMTRFCLVCNYVTRIIDPLASRCSKFRFKAFEQLDAVKRLEYIAEQEDVKLEDDKLLPHLLTVSSGDLRKAITLLQSAKGLIGESGMVTRSIVDEVSGTVPTETVQKLLDAIKLKDSRKLQKVVNDIVLDGWSVTRLLDQIHDTILLDNILDASFKASASLVLSEADRRLSDGADEEIILLDISTKLSDFWKN